jgi:galactokinase
VTLLGEHTDYNAGSALAIATTERTEARATATDAGIVEVRSTALGSASCALDATSGAPPFVLLAASLVRLADARGARIDVDGDLPIAAGLASSASYAVAVALALGVSEPPVDLARACQVAERAAGSDVGLLDQLAVIAALPHCAVELDFATDTTGTFPISSAIGLTAVDSGVRRTVASTAYSQRRDECARAAAELGPLGAVGPDDVSTLVDPELRRRARHVVTECARVRLARGLLESGDVVGFGALIDEGHASLRDDFEVSTPVVEAARDVLRGQDGVMGVRLTGAGFGGCLLVVHDPETRVATDGRWSTSLPGGSGPSVSRPN